MSDNPMEATAACPAPDCYYGHKGAAINAPECPRCEGRGVVEAKFIEVTVKVRYPYDPADYADSDHLIGSSEEALSGDIELWTEDLPSLVDLLYGHMESTTIEAEFVADAVDICEGCGHRHPTAPPKCAETDCVDCEECSRELAGE